AALAGRVADGSVERALSQGGYTALVIQERGDDLTCSFGPDSCAQSRTAIAALAAMATYDSSGREFSLSREKFFLLGGTWLAAMEGEPPTVRFYQHVAFAVDETELP